MTFPFCRGRVINEDPIQPRHPMPLFVVEMVEGKAMQLLCCRLGRLVAVDARSAFEEEARIHEDRGQC